MRRGLLVLAMLFVATCVQLFAAAPAQAHRRYGWGWGHHWGHGWGWGHHRYHGWGHHWGHHNWGFGRGYVYRPYYGFGYGYRPFYGVGYRGFSYSPYFGGYNNCYYPTVNYGYYPSYGYSGCDCSPVYSTGYSTGVYYDTQYAPSGTILNYYGQNGGASRELTAGTVIAQFADALRQPRANQPNGQVTANRIFNGDGRLLNGDGRIRNVVQNIAQGIIRNESLNQNAIVVRSSNLDSRGKARAYMTHGDNMFLEQRYAAAAQQYRAAASLAPDIAEANWRYAHTLVAMGEFDLAVSAVQRAIAASPDTGRSGFTLDTLYGTMGTAKASHLERLAQIALETDSANAYYLVGITLHYSGETDRAEKFFARAADLQGRDVPHIAVFLGPELKPGPERAAPPANRQPPPLLARLPMMET